MVAVQDLVESMARCARLTQIDNKHRATVVKVGFAEGIDEAIA